MKKVKFGFVGLGQRGYSLITTFLRVDSCEIVAVCDVYEDRIKQASKYIKEQRGNEPREYIDFKDMLKDPNIDAIVVATSWEKHIDQTIECMLHHIPVAMEVGGAYSIKDCWRLVKAYEKSKTPMMLLENCCYDRFELLSTALVRHGLLGEVVYCHGAYSHDLRKEILGGNINRHYRLRNYISRNCENYPTHELGPIAKLLKINAGNRLVSLVSVASKSRGLEAYAKTEECPDKSLANQKFKQGDIVTTIITCENGETITLKLDTTTPGWYSREFTVKGTKGIAYQPNNMVRIDGTYKDVWQPDTATEMKNTMNNAEEYKKYLPDYWRNITEEEKTTGHGGMDLYMIKEFINCLINKKPMPIDVYDAASWYAITPLSALSIAHNGKPYKIPDFTKGKYKTRKFSDVVKL